MYGWSAPSPIFVFHTAHHLERGKFLNVKFLIKLTTLIFFAGQSFKQNWDNSHLMSNKAHSYDCFSALITLIIIVQIVIKFEHR